MRILIIEDDIKLCQTMKKQLETASYTVDTCYTGDDSLYYVSKQLYDLIIMDRMLPNLDGLSIIQIMRKRGITTPVIMVTALVGINDKIDGLDAGADDYLAKPFSIEELFARIRALLRRPQTLQNFNQLIFSNMKLDLNSRILSTEAMNCELSKKECDLLEFFIKNKGQILERELILSRVWGPDAFASDGNLDNYISFLRRRLTSLACKAQIKTIYGIGYRLEDF
jgi:DNA-binding response OmpR family regulator